LGSTTFLMQFIANCLLTKRSASVRSADWNASCGSGAVSKWVSV